MALSLALADWLGKVAPIWLSIGIGGGCLVVGGTLGFVISSESLLDQIDLYRERKRLLDHDMDDDNVVVVPPETTTLDDRASKTESTHTRDMDP